MNGWMTCGVKALWVVIMTRKALYKYSPFNHLPWWGKMLYRPFLFIFKMAQMKQKVRASVCAQVKYFYIAVLEQIKVNVLYLYSAFLVFATTQSALHYNSFIHWYYHAGSQPAHQGQFNHSFSFIHTSIHIPLAQQQEQFGVKCLAQGHIDMWIGGAGNQTANLLIGGRPLYLLVEEECRNI